MNQVIYIEKHNVGLMNQVIYIEKHNVGLINQTPTKLDKIWV